MGSTAPPRRVVVTGVGAVTNLGHDTLSTWDAMVRGASGVGPIEGEEFNPWLEDWEVKIAGQVRGFDPASRLDPREARRLDRVAHLGLPAAIEAVEMAGLDFSKENPTRCGVVIGSGIGGLRTIEEGAEVLRRKGPKRVNPFTVPKLMVNSCAGHVSIRFGLEGYSSAHATACASAGHSIIDAVSTIRRDEADVMLAGGAEGAISPICLAAFMTMKALSTRNDEPEKASRPFDR
ncbi:MAG: beta-ketoacyl-[acyl-carrier-protein] synthase II, partial [Planctomycetota bacterium]